MLGLSSAVDKAKLSAVETITAKIMIADEKLNILYINPATRDLMKEAELDLRKELPRFDLATLVGSNIDIFHKNPQHQRNLLSGLQKQHKATIFVGNRGFDLTVTPLLDGGRIKGYVVEWADAMERLMNVDFQNQIEAIGRVQAVVTFTPSAEIITVNENFTKAFGYGLDEVKGRSHRMFVDPAHANSPEYRELWEQLRAGQAVSGEFVRVGKNGKRIVLSASYNPISDSRGHVVKIVKFASDVTSRIENVDRLAQALKALSEGDLTQHIETPFLPSLEKLRTDFNDATVKLRESMQTVSLNAGAIAAASRQIQSASTDLSRRTEQQAAAIEETAASLEEMTTTVSDSSQRALEAGQLVRKTKESAERSGEVVGKAVEAMGKIERSAGEIANIIGVIDEIAFQTNLLALNAGVEAARAGEAGKGFAVVAQEVRELAQRSAKAAKEIKELINASNEHVRDGVALVGNTGKALEEIVGQVVHVDLNVSAIVEGSREQATGLKEINSAVNSMDQGTQQNAAMVEETTAAAHSLAREAEGLFSLLAQFRIGSGKQRESGSALADVQATTAQRQRTAPARAMRGAYGNAVPKEDGWKEF